MSRYVVYALSTRSVKVPGFVATASCVHVIVPEVTEANPPIIQFPLVTGVIEVVPVVPDALYRADGVTSIGVV